MSIAADFWTAEADAVVVPHQPALAVYTNPAGAIVIRQQSATTDDEDAVVLVRPEHAARLAAAILHEAKIIAEETTA